MSEFIKDVAERAGKTFLQFYLGTWMLTSGFLDTKIDQHSASFDLLFTVTNLKAGVVGVALSVATSIGTKQIGDKNSASLIE